MERKIIKGKVISIKNYGAFVKTPDDRVGLCHIKEISDYFVSDITHHLKIGESYDFEIIRDDDKLGLSYKSFRPEMKSKFTPEETKSGFKKTLKAAQDAVLKY